MAVTGSTPIIDTAAGPARSGTGRGARWVRGLARLTRAGRGVAFVYAAVLAGAASTVTLSVAGQSPPLWTSAPMAQSTASRMVATADATPARVLLVPRRNLLPGTQVVSNTLRLSAITVPVGVAVDGGAELSIDGGPWGPGPAVVERGVPLQLRTTVPAVGTSRTILLTTGTEVTAWQVTAADAPTFTHQTLYGPWAACDAAAACQGIGSQTRELLCLRSDGRFVPIGDCDPVLSATESRTCPSPAGQASCAPQPTGSIGGSQYCAAGSTVRAACVGWTCDAGFAQRPGGDGSCERQCGPETVTLSGATLGFPGTLFVGQTDTASGTAPVAGGSRAVTGQRLCQGDGTTTIDEVSSRLSCGGGFGESAGSCLAECGPTTALHDGVTLSFAGTLLAGATEGGSGTLTIDGGTRSATGTRSCGSDGASTFSDLAATVSCSSGYQAVGTACVRLCGPTSTTHDGVTLSFAGTLLAGATEGGSGTLTIDGGTRSATGTRSCGSDGASTFSDLAATVSCSSGYQAVGTACVRVCGPTSTTHDGVTIAFTGTLLAGQTEGGSGTLTIDGGTRTASVTRSCHQTGTAQTFSGHSSAASCSFDYDRSGTSCVRFCPSGFNRVNATQCNAVGYGCGCPAGSVNTCGAGPGWGSGTASRCVAPSGWREVAASYSWDPRAGTTVNSSGTGQALCYHHGAVPSCGNRGNIQPPAYANYNWSLTIAR